MTSKWKAVLGVILIFVLGFASGIVCSSIVVHRKLNAYLKQPGAVAAAALEKQLTQNLNLDPNQQQEIHGYFMENLQRRRELNLQIRPQAQMLNQQTFQRIATTLRPDQRELFRQNIEKFRNRLSKAAANADWDNLPPAPGAGPGAPSPQH